MFSVQEVASRLEMTTQAIYKDKYMQEHHYLYKDSFGKSRITEEGYNYLRERRIRSGKIKTTPTTNQEQPTNQPTSKQIEQVLFENSTISGAEVYNLLYNQLKQQIATLENQLAETQKEKDYFKSKFEEANKLVNAYISSHLLQPPKKSFFSWGKKEKNNSEKSTENL